MTGVEILTKIKTWISQKHDSRLHDSFRISSPSTFVSLHEQTAWTQSVTYSKTEGVPCKRQVQNRQYDEKRLSE